MKTFFVYYNGVYIARYRRISACLSFIERKGLQDDSFNVLRIVDKDGDMYNTITGNKIKF